MNFARRDKPGNIDPPKGVIVAPNKWVYIKLTTIARPKPKWLSFTDSTGVACQSGPSGRKTHDGMKTIVR